MQHKNTYEIIIVGRGGQGAKTTAELLVQAAVRTGRFVQAYPEFGPERSGAPVKTYVRLSDQPIRTHQPIDAPECILVLDEQLLSNIYPIIKQKKDIALVVNSRKSKAELAQRYGLQAKQIVVVDASGMAMDIIGENRPNTVILGKFSFVTEKVSLEDICRAFEEKYAEKLGKEKTEKNIEAIRRAYDEH